MMRRDRADVVRLHSAGTPPGFWLRVSAADPITGSQTWSTDERVGRLAPFAPREDEEPTPGRDGHLAMDTVRTGQLAATSHRCAKECRKDDPSPGSTPTTMRAASRDRRRTTADTCDATTSNTLCVRVCP